MKQRIITACVGLCVLAVVLHYYDTWALNLAISLISLMAVEEVLRVIQPGGSKVMIGIGLTFSVLIPFFPGRLCQGTAAADLLRLYPGAFCDAAGPSTLRCMWKRWR